MDALVTADVLLFEGFRLDRRGLSRCDDQGCYVPVPLGSRALEVLGVLVARSGDLVARDEIMNVVWPGVVVESSNLPVQIAALRRVLDDGRTGSCIQTVPGRGYRFVLPVTRVDANPHSVPQTISDGGERPRPRLSIVVLPFTNLSSDPEQQYFADGITEDLTTDLSRIANMFVISSNTAFTYRNKPIDTKQIGCELGVRYVLEGSVRLWDNRVRVNAQLIDAETDAHLWAERFDGNTRDLFALQNEVINRIAVALNLELVAAEAARPIKNPDALDFILRGRAALLKPGSSKAMAEAISLFEQALSLDPQSAEAQLGLAHSVVRRVVDRMTDSPARDLARAEGLIDQALAGSSRNALAHVTRGLILRAQGRFERAIAEYETALSSNPNLVGAIADIGRCKIYIGPIDEAIPAQEQAIRLSPRDPNIGSWCFRIGEAHFLQSRTERAIEWFEKARNYNPAMPHFRFFLASAYALQGDAERATAELVEAQKLAPEGTHSSIARIKVFSSQIRGARPEIRALFEATFYAGLRKAGIPEE